MSTRTMNVSYLVAATHSVLHAAFPDLECRVRATWKRSISGMMGGIHDERVVRVDYPSGPPAAEVAAHLHRFIQRWGHRVEVRCGKEAPVVVEYESVGTRNGEGVSSLWDFLAASTFSSLRRAIARGDPQSAEERRQELLQRGYQVFVVEAPNGGPTTCWLLDPREWRIDVQ